MSWRRLLFSIGLGLGLTLFAVQAWQAYQSFQQYQFCLVRPIYLLGSVGLSLVAYLVQMTAWSLIMAHFNAPLRAQTVAVGYVLSFLPRYIPGSVWGYVSRSEWLNEYHDVPYASSSAASLLEIMAQLLTALALVAVYLASARWRIGVLMVALIILWLGWLAFPHLVNWFGRGKFYVTTNHARRFWRWLVTSFLYLVFWGLHGAALTIMSKALCGNTEVNLATGIFSFSLAWVIGFAVLVVPAGLGVRELTMTSLLTQSAGLPQWQASLIAITARLTLIVAELIFVLVALYLHFQSRVLARDDRSSRSSNGEGSIGTDL